MILSDLDLFIIKEIAESAIKDKEITTWDLAKRYDWDIDWIDLMPVRKKMFLDGKTTSIIYRLKRMADEGLVIVEKENKKNKYVLDSDRIRYGKHRFPNGMRDSIMACDSENKWTIFEL